MPDAARRFRPQHVLTVEGTEQLGPHLVRVEFSGESLGEFGGAEYTDAYVKLIFVDPTLGLRPPYDLPALRESLPAEQQPVTRTYTVRRVDRSARRLWIDFVTHGDTGLAGPWAEAAQPGDTLVVSGPGGGFTPDRHASWHVFVGDLSAVPAIAAAMEVLPESARGVALLEVPDEGDILSLSTEGLIDVRWMVNPHPEDTQFLARALDDAVWPPNVRAEGTAQVFAHGERESIKAIRRVLKEHEVPRSDISISGYWARGRTENVFQAEKREPVGQIGD